MTFGSSCEPREESPREKRRRKRSEAQKEKAATVDPFERIVVFCSVRDQSACELKEKLTKEGYTQEAIEGALERALNCGLVDDIRFAEGLIRGRLYAGKGAQGVEQDLAKHNIDVFQLEGWPDEYGYSEYSQVERAVELLNAHPPKAKDYWSAAFRKLVSKGYSKGIASRATRLWAESLNRE